MFRPGRGSVAHVSRPSGRCSAFTDCCMTGALLPGYFPQNMFRTLVLRCQNELRAQTRRPPHRRTLRQRTASSIGPIPPTKVGCNVTRLSPLFSLSIPTMPPPTRYQQVVEVNVRVAGFLNVYGRRSKVFMIASTLSSFLLGKFLLWHPHLPRTKFSYKVSSRC